METTTENPTITINNTYGVPIKYTVADVQNVYNEYHKNRDALESYKKQVKKVLQSAYSEHKSDVIQDIADELDIDIKVRKQVSLTVTVNVWIETPDPDLDESHIDNCLSVDSVSLNAYSDYFEITDWETECHEVTNVFDD